MISSFPIEFLGDETAFVSTLEPSWENTKNKDIDNIPHKLTFARFRWPLAASVAQQMAINIPTQVWQDLGHIISCVATSTICAGLHCMRYPAEMRKFKEIQYTAFNHINHSGWKFGKQTSLFSQQRLHYVCEQTDVGRCTFSWDECAVNSTYVQIFEFCTCWLMEGLRALVKFFPVDLPRW